MKSRKIIVFGSVGMFTLAAMIGMIIGGVFSAKKDNKKFCDILDKKIKDTAVDMSLYKKVRFAVVAEHSTDSQAKPGFKVFEQNGKVEKMFDEKPQDTVVKTVSDEITNLLSAEGKDEKSFTDFDVNKIIKPKKTGFLGSIGAFFSSQDTNIYNDIVKDITTRISKLKEKDVKFIAIEKDKNVLKVGLYTIPSKPEKIVKEMKETQIVEYKFSKTDDNAFADKAVYGIFGEQLKKDVQAPTN